ncbi:cytochrome-c oxidase, cbb3-type subunit III [Bauldia litoralis]|uniref:Cbb3-type cytochrome c oxidase subunit n=1 Tax=Bauldia litoralis TaxID=665467 RepID=A0A1G6DZC9_9HYPH|nr:cytochrome-c oxidase, cbb3-type subunit III [Bauldia litoralis]SDB50496.1 cytochrome c oxidase cbb3-type subunit 3 [Bauldia litoralis]
MADSEHNEPRLDPVTGYKTTGHDWDGIEELNHPLPRWWLWIFYACIAWSVVYWFIFPAWPLVWSATGGLIGWNSRTAVDQEVAALETNRGPMIDRLTSTEIAAIKDDPELLDFTRAYGSIAFKENCAPCHGVGGGGSKGYPNLIDDDWLWGGSIDNIGHTIAYGVRNDNADSRYSEMPAFGRDGLLSGAEIREVVYYVRSLADLPVPSSADLTAGAEIYARDCASCHGEAGTGDQELGAPNLTDAIWLYGSDTADMIATVTNARNSSMPAWGERLDPTTVKALTFYVHNLGGGD